MVKLLMLQGMLTAKRGDILSKEVQLLISTKRSVSSMCFYDYLFSFAIIKQVQPGIFNPHHDVIMEQLSRKYTPMDRSKIV
jgi:hypothetical protein